MSSTTSQITSDDQLPAHSAAKRSSRRKESFPDDFDARAKAKAEQVTKLHEFRRENIKEFEPPKKDYFEYDPAEPKRYDALKLDTLFKFQSTYKAIKWGVFVGSLFAFHRYFRTRDIQAAAHWFTVMSFVSFFNIWISYGLQEFVTEYGSRKNLSLAQRNEYHQNAYKNYIDGVQNKVEMLDDRITPVLHNSQAQALDEFLDNYQGYIKERFNTRSLSRDEIIDKLVKKVETSSQNEELTEADISQIQMIQKDKYQRKLHTISREREAIERLISEVLVGVEKVDLKSFEFEKDPDMSFTPDKI